MRSWMWVALLLGCEGGGGGLDPAEPTDGATAVVDQGGAGGEERLDAGFDPDVGEGPPCLLNDEAACGPDRICSILGRCLPPNPPVVLRTSLRRGAGVIFIEAEVGDGERDALTFHLALGGAEHTVPLGLTVAPTLLISTHWLTPETGTQAQVWAVDGAGLASERVVVEVEEIRIAAAGSACDPEGLQSWCGEGALCLTWEDTGRCFPVEAHLWTRNDGVLVDVTAEAEPEWTSGWFTVGDRLASPTYLEHPTGWRWVGFVPVLEGAPEVRHQGHLVAGGLEVGTPPERRAGAACDPARLVDVCAAGTACLFSVCTPVQAPVLQTLSAQWDNGVLGFVATGTDPDHDLEGFRFGSGMAGVFQADQDGRTSGMVVWEGDRFTAWWSGPLAGDRPEVVRVFLVDAEGLESAPGDARVGLPASEAVVADGMCDTSGLLFRCGEGRTCGRTDADATPRCRLPDTTCPGATAMDFEAAGTLVGAPDHTEVTCGDGWGPDARHLFTAPTAGRYRFTLDPESFYAYLALRRSCTQRAELACTRALEEPAVLEVDLAAGETITAVVEQAICRCNPGPYTLSVEQLP